MEHFTFLTEPESLEVYTRAVYRPQREQEKDSNQIESHCIY